LKAYKVFYIGVFFLILTFAVDALIFINKLYVLGMISLISSSLIFSCAFIWFLYRDEQKPRVKNLFIVFPIGIFCVAILKFLKLGLISYQAAPEDLLGVGNILMSRYELGLWIISSLILLSFVLTGALLVRRAI
jgi:hypothetical protein